MENAFQSDDELLKHHLMVAMCHGNRGIAYKRKLPWPSLKKDVEYYTRMISTLSNKENQGKKIIHIRGRKCWEDTADFERNLPNVYHVVISSTLSMSNNSHPRVFNILPTFLSALEFLHSPDIIKDIDSIWVMGGTMVYKDAMEHAQCGMLYVTHIYTDFPSDTFFPKFEQSFKEVSTEGQIYEDSDIKFEFKIYEKL